MINLSSVMEIGMIAKLICEQERFITRYMILHCIRYPKVNISTSSYQRLLKKMGDFDAELTILRIFAHEVGHYFDYISQYKSYQNEDCEKIANDYEEDMIQDFIDEVYYIYYSEEN